jgi:hypothetical protein
MAKYSAVIPLLHKQCKLFRYAPIVLEEGKSVRSLRPEHLGAIFGKNRKLSEQISSQSKCIIVEDDDEPPTKELMERVAICGSFALNVFSEEGSISCGQAFLIRHVRAHIVIDVYDSMSYSPEIGQ